MNSAQGLVISVFVCAVGFIVVQNASARARRSGYDAGCDATRSEIEREQLRERVFQLEDKLRIAEAAKL